MKKLFLSLVAAIVATTATFAQSSLLATLTHTDGNGPHTFIYYGTTALSQAHEAAVDGDIITLSSGSFDAVDITKGVTIRGAGMEIDPTTKSEPTVITGTFNISIPETTTERLTIEGIYSNYDIRVASPLSGATFMKSRFKKIGYTGNPVITNLTMIHCKVVESITTCSNSSITFLNSIIWEPTIDGHWEFLNCIIKKNNINYFFENSTFKNCIFVAVENRTFPASDVIFNCVLASSDPTYNQFSTIYNATNTVEDYSKVFKTCTSGTYSDSETFELTDNAAVTYLGTDNRQVGIYGGILPFNPRPSNPQITNCVVAPKSDANGKLSINVTVQGAE